MKQLIPMDAYGVFADTSETVWANSLQVAEVFGKRHDDVLKSIRNLDCSEEFRLRNFAESSYRNEQGKRQPCIAMTRNGFMFLVMGYRGAKAAAIKEAYIKRFDEMQEFVCSFSDARQDFPLLTAHIKAIYPDAKPYHYSNEFDMLNRLVTGMSTRQFRELHGLEKGKSIRPYLTNEQIEMLDRLQKVDMGLMIAIPDYESRKNRLEQYKAEMLCPTTGKRKELTA